MTRRTPLRNGTVSLVKMFCGGPAMAAYGSLDPISTRNIDLKFLKNRIKSSQIVVP
jgi:hypothetical protein